MAVTMALLLMLFAAVITVGATQIGVGDQKAMGNEVRNQEAVANAEGAIDAATMYLKTNAQLVRSTGTVGTATGWMAAGNVKWTACTASTTTVPCGDGTNNIFDNNWLYYSNVPHLGSDPVNQKDYVAHYVTHVDTTNAALPGRGVYYVIGEGKTSDELGHALVRKGVAFIPPLLGSPPAPLVAAGTANLSGTISLVTNPNGGGTGVPLSVWSGATVATGGSDQTCYMGEFLNDYSGSTGPSVGTDSSGNSFPLCDTCTCPSADTYTLSSGGSLGNDVVASSPNFPTDLFQYLFGYSTSAYQTVKNYFTLGACNSSTFNASAPSLLWITGSCTLNNSNVAGSTVGSPDHPVLLVVENGDFQINGGIVFYGLIFVFGHDASGNQVHTYTLSLTGGATLYGSMLTNGSVNFGGGSNKIVYSSNILAELSLPGPDGGSLAAVPGTWRDY